MRQNAWTTQLRTCRLTGEGLRSTSVVLLLGNRPKCWALLSCLLNRPRTTDPTHSSSYSRNCTSDVPKHSLLTPPPGSKEHSHPPTPCPPPLSSPPFIPPRSVAVDVVRDMTKQRFKAYVQQAQKERDRRSAAQVLKKLVQVRVVRRGARGGGGARARGDEGGGACIEGVLMQRSTGLQEAGAGT
jgi:hypothetical protein